MSIWIFLAIVILSLAAWDVALGGRLPRAFRSRGCMGKSWVRAFPGAARRDIREFLSLFAGAFLFKEREKLRFGPADQVLAVYRAVYPHQWMPDSMEVECFATELNKRYGIDLGLMWREDLTLGDVFAATRRGDA